VDSNGLWDWDESAGGDATDEELQARADNQDLSRRQRNKAKKQLAFRQSFRVALDAAFAAADSPLLSGNEQDTAAAALGAYGDEGDSNGVTVGVRNGGGADTMLWNVGNPWGFSVKFGSEDKGDFLTATVLHEGVHVLQGNLWLGGVGSGSPLLGVAFDLNHYFLEQQAWTLEGSFAKALGMKSLAPQGRDASYQVWNAGWKAADVATMRSKGVAKIVEGEMHLKPSDTNTYSSEHLPLLLW
jgi:hypothetical protein